MTKPDISPRRLTADDLAEFMGQFIAAKQYASLEYLFESILRQASRPDAASKFMPLAQAVKSLLSGPVVEVSPGVHKQLYGFYIRLLTKGLISDQIDSKAVRELVDELLVEAVLNLDSGHQGLIARGAIVLGGFPAFLAASVANKDMAVFAKWLDDYTIPYFLLVREDRFDDFKRASAVLINIFGKSSLLSEPTDVSERAVSEFYRRFGSGLQNPDLAIKKEGGRQIRIKNLLSVYRVLADIAAKFKKESWMVDMALAEERAIGERTDLQIDYYHDIEFFLKLSVDNGFPALFGRAFAMWRKAYRRESAGELLLMSYLTVFVRLLSSNPAWKEVYAQKMTHEFCSAMRFLTEEDVNPFHSMFYPFCYFLEMLWILSKQKPPQELEAFVSVLNRRMKAADVKIVYRRTRELFTSFVSSSITEEDYLNLWQVISKAGDDGRASSRSAG